MYYLYDANGNITLEQYGAIADGETIVRTMGKKGNVYGTDYGFALSKDGETVSETTGYQRTYSWNERNQLRTSADASATVQYRYGADGQRAIKQSSRGENLYYNTMWQLGNNYTSDIRQSKHIYVGETRIATKCSKRGQEGLSYEIANTYWYHSDHLGSAQLVTDTAGEIHERIEYTPYGELWIEEVEAGVEKLPFRFTGKEIDEETGLYYYGARYLDPKYSRWLSPDPALGEYIPGAPVNEEAKKRNGNLPGMGGVFNTVNLHLYHYAGNNPVKFVDPDGKLDKEAIASLNADEGNAGAWSNTDNKFYSGNYAINSAYLAPTDSKRLTSVVGVRKDATPAQHTGDDIDAITRGIKGDKLYAIEDGKVLDIRTTKTGVSVLELSLPNGDTAVYMHGDYSMMKKGSSVHAGDVVGTMSDVGSTGQVHLHFEIRLNGKYTELAKNAVNPLNFLPRIYKLEK